MGVVSRQVEHTAIREHQVQGPVARDGAGMTRFAADTEVEASRCIDVAGTVRRQRHRLIDDDTRGGTRGERIVRGQPGSTAIGKSVGDHHAGVGTDRGTWVGGGRTRDHQRLRTYQIIHLPHRHRTRCSSAIIVARGDARDNRQRPRGDRARGVVEVADRVVGTHNDSVRILYLQARGANCAVSTADIPIQECQHRGHFDRLPAGQGSQSSTANGSHTAIIHLGHQRSRHGDGLLRNRHRTRCTRERVVGPGSTIQA